LQLPERAGIGPGEDTDASAVSATVKTIEIQDPDSGKLDDELATAPYRNAWVFTCEYIWIKSYTIVFVRATDSLRTKFARVGMECLDNR
jgi:hypothetical protein